MATDKPRIALYSPGMVGLGHMRRNLLLVRSFAELYPSGSFLMITEAREAGIFDFPDNVDCLSLPALQKEADGRCSARRLGIEVPELVRLRTDVISAALNHFAPDVLVVDHLPRGALGELGPSLEMLREKGKTRLVLGLRDILEEPDIVRSEWARLGHEETIQRFYEAIWIYGDPTIFDMRAEYKLPPVVAEKARFTGYLNPVLSDGSGGAEDADNLTVKLLAGARFVLCQVGGGQDGTRLAQAFAEAEMPEGMTGILLTGPFMPRGERDALSRRARQQSAGVHVLDFISEPIALLSRAEQVITMGGYNSVCEVLSLNKRALIIPRIAPRREQLIRAQRLARLGLIEFLDPQALTPGAISEWLVQPPAPVPLPRSIDMNGLHRASCFLEEVVEGRWTNSQAALRNALDLVGATA